MANLKKKKSLRYAAKLLFQFRVMVDGQPGKMRTCEERIINYRAKSGRQALAIAKRKGRAAEYNYRNSGGNPVFFEFVGVLDLMSLGIECGPDEAWYDIVNRLTPMERKRQLIPSERTLSAICEDEGRRYTGKHC